MSQPSPDAKAVVRAAEQLTTQVRRIADALSTPVVRTEVATDDDAATTYNLIADNMPLATCRRMETRTCPESYNGPCGDRPCARFESEDPTPWLDTAAAPATEEQLSVKRISHPLILSDEQLQAAQERAALADQAADEDTQRAVRRDSLRILLGRAQRVGLTWDEGDLLRQHTEAEIREADTAREVAAGNKRHVQLIVPELERTEARRAEEERLRLALAKERDRWKERAEQARGERDRSDEAARLAREQRQEMAEERHAWQERGDRAEDAIERVRDLHASVLRMEALVCAHCGHAWPCDTVRALDGTEPTTEQPVTCTATIPNSFEPGAAFHRCAAPAGHYDESNEPVFTEEEHSPGGWHDDGQGHVWSDRATGATPHTATEPTTKEN
ncbi:hypothetical protein [Streptomyces sp. NPDC059224]|uniref:hypothetical protein n=1 Tax=Streptomyces sp. NPDC059224 TaxID=3346775 RepID=UPI00369ED111